jgi:hypothetical protein
MKKKKPLARIAVLIILVLGFVLYWATRTHLEINSAKVTQIRYVRFIDSGPYQGYYYTPITLTSDQSQRILNALSRAHTPLVPPFALAGPRGYLWLHYDDGGIRRIALHGSDLVRSAGDQHLYVPHAPISDLLEAEIPPPPTTMSDFKEE